MHVWTVLRYVAFGGDKGGGVAYAVIAASFSLSKRLCRHELLAGGVAVTSSYAVIAASAYAVTSSLQVALPSRAPMPSLPAPTRALMPSTCSLFARRRACLASRSFNKLAFQMPLKRVLRLTFSLSVVDEHASLLALVARAQDLCKP
jgi:hypothetical protein